LLNRDDARNCEYLADLVGWHGQRDAAVHCPQALADLLGGSVQLIAADVDPEQQGIPVG